MRLAERLALTLIACVFVSPARADTTLFFEPCQTYTPVASGVTSETIQSGGYVFTLTRDKLFTGGTGQPIGRQVRVPWPQGVEAQAVTTPPPGVTDHAARITMRRADGQVFDFKAFSAKLLANTAGAGASIEIMPVLNGEDGFADPLYFDATGYYGMVVSYDPSPNPWGSTALLVGFDTYKIGLYVDYALVALTLGSPSTDPQSCCLPGSACVDLTSTACAQQGGTALGTGTSCGCDHCAFGGNPPPVPDGSAATNPVRAGRIDPMGSSLRVTWDAASCPPGGVNLLYGDLASAGSYALTGAVCGLALGGDAVWAGVPDLDLYFLLVGVDGAGTESSWGVDGNGLERNGVLASGLCGVTAKSVSATCP